MDNRNNFKIIAVRVLKGCSEYIKKVLKENQFYYLCNDYNINEAGNYIYEANKNIKPLYEDFFTTSDTKVPVINLSAIVGKNGDGKSSLVELVIRLLNNCSCRYTMDPNGEMLLVDGVCAELYYQIDGTFYRLQEKDGSTTIICYDYNREEQSLVAGRTLGGDEIKEHFFYTMVSNYSHYAYNTEEVDRTIPNVGKDDKHWLHNVFHKNDGYQAPLSLHPYRWRGNIDINKERELSKQRVFLTYIHEYLKENSSEDTVMSFNGKRAVELRLTDIGYSKLQEISLKDFFKSKAGVRLLQPVIDFVSDTESMQYELERENDNYTPMFVNYGEALKKAYHKYFSHRRNQELFEYAYSWLIANDLIETRSDVTELVNCMTNLVGDVLSGRDKEEIKNVCEQWMKYAGFSLIQIQRIELIDEICDCWREYGLNINGEMVKIDVDPTIVFKPFEELSDTEKCLHYMVYKTISIFETYSSYEYPCNKYESEALFFGDSTPGFLTNIDSYTNFRTVQPFLKLSQDWALGSHITLKLHQTYNYLKNTDDSTRNIYKFEDKITTRSIYFRQMSQETKNKLTDITNIPPAIFYWDLYFRKDSEATLISLESFSSGEKQKLFCQSAIIYHLQNISSIGTEEIHYPNVNLILEEIELYFHPEWQRTFTYELMQLIRGANIKNIASINILFVTHSPYILSDIPKNNVLFLDEGKPVYTMQENTFGANVNSLLKNGFFLPSLPMGEFAHKKINSLFSKLHSGNFNANELSSIYAEILTVGEPAIRHQLMMLYNTYKQLDSSLDDAAFREFILRKLNNDTHRV